MKFFFRKLGNFLSEPYTIGLKVKRWWFQQFQQFPAKLLISYFFNANLFLVVKFSSEGLKKISFEGTPIVPKNDGRRNGIENEAKASRFIKLNCQITAQGCHCSI